MSLQLIAAWALGNTLFVAPEVIKRWLEKVFPPMPCGKYSCKEIHVLSTPQGKYFSTVKEGDSYIILTDSII